MVPCLGLLLSFDRAVGGTRTRVHLSGAQGPHLSATTACVAVSQKKREAGTPLGARPLVSSCPIVGRCAKGQSPGGLSPAIRPSIAASRAVNRPASASASIPMTESFRCSGFIGLVRFAVVMVTAPFSEERRAGKSIPDTRFLLPQCRCPRAQPPPPARRWQSRLRVGTRASGFAGRVAESQPPRRRPGPSGGKVFEGEAPASDRLLNRR